VGLVAPRLPEAKIKKKKLGCCSASKSEFAGIWDQIKFSRVSSTHKTCFYTQNVGDLKNLRSGSQIFDKCMCHVFHDVCGVCGED